MIAVPIHEVVSVSPVLLPQLFQDLFNLVLGEVCVAEVEALLVPELLAQLPRLPGADIEYPGEGEGVTPIGVLSPVHLETRVIHPDPHGRGVVVGPEHVVDVEDDWLPGHVEDGGLLNLLSLICRSAEGQFTGTIHHFGKSIALYCYLGIYSTQFHSSDNHFQFELFISLVMRGEGDDDS